MEKRKKYDPRAAAKRSPSPPKEPENVSDGEESVKLDSVISQKPNEQSEVGEHKKNNEQSYLKRKSKNPEEQKLNWNGVDRRVDCWQKPRQGSKVSTREPAFGIGYVSIEDDDLTIPDERGSRFSRDSRDSSPSRKEMYQEASFQSQAHDYPIETEQDDEDFGIPGLSAIETSAPRRRRVKNNIHELEVLFRNIHGDQELKVWSEHQKRSIVPVISERSIFVDCYNEDIYDIILEDLRNQYEELCDN